MADTVERDARANLAAEATDAVQERGDYQGP